MNYPEHCDDRAKKYFRWGYVGSGVDGATSDGCKYSWEGHRDAVPTQHYDVNGNYSVCVYCGNRCFSIQKYIPSNYDITGYACICKDAMDEVDLRKELDELLQKQAGERADLRKRLPKLSKDVMKQVVHKRMQTLTENIERDFFTTNALKSFKILIQTPFDDVKSYEYDE